jgi:V8-like Glu-specific endopeptidase
MASAPATPLFLDRLADEADYAVIGPTDGRSRVRDAARFPYSAVCHLMREFSDGSQSGATGFLIDSRTVVTAAHCLMSPARRLLGRQSVPSRIRVVPGRNGGAVSGPFGVAEAAHWYVPRRYQARFNRAFDYGLIRLARPLAARDFFPLATLGNDELARVRQSRLLHISGYPGDKPRGTQWVHAERLDKKDAARLYYSVDTCPGHSGAPIWIENWQDRRVTVIGIHTAGPTPHAEGPWGCRPGIPLAPQGMFNRGVRMTRRVMGELEALRRGTVPPTMIRLT